jgi:hypothetical protein
MPISPHRFANILFLTHLPPPLLLPSFFLMLHPFTC